MELKLSDEQYEKIGRESVAEWQKSCHPNTKSAYIAVGRNAVELSNAEVLPAVLAEPSNAEIDKSLCQVRPVDARPWENVDYDRVRRIFANRLARFTAPKDTAVEALEKRFSYCLSRELIVEAVAAVRAADREAGR